PNEQSPRPVELTRQAALITLSSYAKNSTMNRMKIGIISSMHHSEKMLEVAEQLRAMGHDCVHSRFASNFVGKNDEEKEKIKLHQKFNEDAIRDFWHKLQDCDAVLVLNFERHGIPN